MKGERREPEQPKEMTEPGDQGPQRGITFSRGIPFRLAYGAEWRLTRCGPTFRFILSPSLFIRDPASNGRGEIASHQG
jgi:hypothetical protein